MLMFCFALHSKKESQGNTEQIQMMQGEQAWIFESSDNSSSNKGVEVSQVMAEKKWN